MAAMPLAAQNVSATLNGTVRDVSGAVIVNAGVTLTNDATGASRAAHSNAEGYFVFTDLLAGNYSLALELSGFKKYRLNEINLTAGQTRALGQLTMTLGEVADHRRRSGEHRHPRPGLSGYASSAAGRSG